MSKKFQTTISVKRVDISFFNKLVLKQVYIEDQKHDTLLYIDNLIASVSHLNFKKQELKLSSVEFVRAKIHVSMDEQHLPNYSFLIDGLRNSSKKKDPQSWTISCETFSFDQAQVGYAYFEQENLHLIDIQNIKMDVSDFEFDEDSVYFRINKMQLDDHKSFQLKNLTGDFVSRKKYAKLSQLNLSTGQSEVRNATIIFDQTKLDDGADITESYIDLMLDDSELDLRDLATVVPDIKGMDQKLQLSGHIYGKINELKARKLQIKTGKSTTINCDFYINGLPEINRAFIQLDLNNSTLDFKDLAEIRLPDRSPTRYPKISNTLYEAGLIRYNGNFTGFLSDFVAYGTINSNFGRIDTDLSFKPGEQENLDVSGHLKTVNFKLGKLTQTSKLGKLTFTGRIDGRFNQITNVLDAKVEGTADSIMVSDYMYKNIILDGLIQNQKFEGDLVIDDENLKCTFNGKVNVNPDSSLFDFKLLLHKADLVALKIDKVHQKSELSMHINANFTGSTIDDLKGIVQFEGGKYTNENNSILLNSLSLTTSSGENNKLELNSDFLDAEIEGSYQFISLSRSIENLIAHYMPSSGAKISKTPGLNRFSLNAEIKDTAPILRTFYPRLTLSPGYITGVIDETKNQINLYTEISDIQLNGLYIKGYSLSLHSTDKLEFKSRIEELEISENQHLYNIAVLASAKDDEMSTKLLWNNYDVLTYSGELEGFMKFTMRENNRAHVDLKIEPSKIYVADTLWQINPSYVTIDSSRVEVDNFMISNRNQFISLNGVISKEQTDELAVRINNFKLDNFNLITGENNKLTGILDGTISLVDLYNRALFLSDVKLNDFKYNDTKVGNVSVLSKWDTPSNAIQSELIVSNKQQQNLYGYGSYFPTQDSLDFTINTEALSLSLLEPFLEGSFQDIRGEATGEVKITGKHDKIMMYGDVMANNAGLALSYLQVGYKFTNKVKFRGDSIIFDHITINDSEGNSGVFNGSIRHDNFSNMDYNLSVNSKNLQVINTTPAINERFYGKAYAAGVVKITGHGREIFIDGNARTLNHTALNIALDYEEEAQEYDFIKFVDHSKLEDKNMRIRTSTDQSVVFMNFNIQLTPEARFQLVYNSQVGDMIRAQGTGNIQLKIDPNYNIEMFGEYTIDRGDYLFTLQNVINKKFEIESLGTIQWNGDPYDATINVNAIYRLKASLSELFANSTENVNYSQRIPVNCKIALKDQLSNPTIGFDIEFPTAEDRIKDEVLQYLSTEEDMNKQILSLLVMGRFYTPEYLRGSYESQNSNLVGTTASELFSNQLSNWLSQISNDFDIGVNYRPGNQISDDEIELALSTQFFNDRVTINGNISNNVNQTGSTINNNSADFVGDFDVTVKLTNNGKLQFKAYNQSNNSLIYETSPYKQGIGISYRESYDTFGELWQKFINLFRKRKRAN
ncbi:translocation/assembly module TamB domain-containing protein [Mangrovibacterium sp.]|uniref:translocation/assembly module TamB domain-containing protein n=1 Tax=Mangrovibacterium sp. TaxID=1961364 RepID=UPI0035640905